MNRILILFSILLRSFDLTLAVFLSLFSLNSLALTLKTFFQILCHILLGNNDDHGGVYIFFRISLWLYLWCWWCCWCCYCHCANAKWTKHPINGLTFVHIYFCECVWRVCYKRRQKFAHNFLWAELRVADNLNCEKRCSLSMSSLYLFTYERFEGIVVCECGGAYFFSARVSPYVCVCACESFDVRGLIGCVQCRQRSSLRTKIW